MSNRKHSTVSVATDSSAAQENLNVLYTAHQVHTMAQVVSADPVPPRQLQPQVPRDLQTICLKCLEKNPQRRYESAGEMRQALRSSNMPQTRTITQDVKTQRLPVKALELQPTVRSPSSEPVRPEQDIQEVRPTIESEREDKRK